MEDDGWNNDLPGIQLLSSEDEDSPVRVNIGRLQAQGGSYEHKTPCGFIIKIADQPEKGLSFQIWPSSLTLIRFAECQPEGFWKGKRVLELGCGCGLVGIVLASLGATVALTDLPETMDMLHCNIRQNETVIEESGGSATAFPFVWGQTKMEDLEEAWQRLDIILAADVIYHRELFDPLLSALSDFGQANKDCQILLSHVRRWKSDKAFFSRAKKRFLIETIEQSEAKPKLHASRARGELEMYRMTWKK